jgi:inner membrane protein
MTIGGLAAAAFLGIPAGLALDIIEPASHPHHRGPAHSVAAFAGLVTLAQKIWNSPVPGTAKIWALALLAGVGSHHVLDVGSTKGLPLTGLARHLSW